MKWFLGLILILIAQKTAPSESKPLPFVRNSQFIHLMLRTIASVETNSGENLNHKIINTGLNKGTRAYGRYGITLILIKETAKLDKNIDSLYPELKNLALNKIEAYAKKRPELEERIARSHLLRLQRHFGNDPSKIGYAWLSGISSTYKRIKHKKRFDNHWYVNKILKIYKNL